MTTKNQMVIDRTGNTVVTCSVGAFSAEDLTPLADALSAEDVSYYVAGAAGDVDLDPQGRNMLFSLLRKKGIKVVAVSDSKIVKGIVTAASWMGVAVQSRSWNDLGVEQDEMLAPSARSLLLRQKQECQLQSLRAAAPK